MQWLSALDVGLALSNVSEDMKGDWYRDPWGWPEYDYVRANPDVLSRRLDGSSVKRVAKIDVAKENFSTRPAVVLDPLDRLAYQALVDLQSKSLIGALDEPVNGWRLPFQEPRAGRYANMADEWREHRRNLIGQVGFYQYGLKTDVVSYFASIPVERICEEIERRCGGGAVTERLTDLLLAWERVPDRDGIPQRSAASCVLGNMYMAKIDHLLNIHSASQPAFLGVHVGAYTRWMDDIWAFADDEAPLRHLQVDLSDALREAGLEMNLGKTEVLDGDELASSALRIEHSAVDEALAEGAPNLTPLEELLDTIIDDPIRQDRTTIRFALTRMRRHRVATRIDKLVDAAPRMPQGADHLARAFRDLGTWKDLQEWFVNYRSTPWARIEWSVAQLGTMFPTRAGAQSKTPLGSAVQDFFLALLSERSSLPLFALVAQRLSSWRPDKCREAMREAARIEEHPLARRVIALTSLMLHEEKRFIARLLSEYEENQVTLAMIENADFRAFPTVSDFSAEKPKS